MASSPVRGCHRIGTPNIKWTKFLREGKRGGGGEMRCTYWLPLSVCCLRLCKPIIHYYV